MGCAVRFIRACVDAAVQVRACELGLGFVGVWEECDACDARLLRGSDCGRHGDLWRAIAKVRLLPGKGFFFFFVRCMGRTQTRVCVDGTCTGMVFVGVGEHRPR